MKTFKITQNLPANKFDHGILLEEFQVSLSLEYKDILLGVDRDINGNPEAITITVPDHISLASITNVISAHNPEDSEKEKATKIIDEINTYLSINKIKELEFRIIALEKAK